MPLKYLQFAESGMTNRSISVDFITIGRQFDFKVQPEHDKGAVAFRDDPSICLSAAEALKESERGDALRKAAHLASSSVLMHDTASNTACHFWLGVPEGGLSSVLVASFERSLNPLHVVADAAHARTVYFGAAVVATDALLGLRRIGHICPRSGRDKKRLEFNWACRKRRINRRKAAHLATRCRIVKRKRNRSFGALFP